MKHDFEMNNEYIRFLKNDFSQRLPKTLSSNFNKTVNQQSISDVKNLREGLSKSIAQIPR